MSEAVSGHNDAIRRAIRRDRRIQRAATCMRCLLFLIVIATIGLGGLAGYRAWLNHRMYRLSSTSSFLLIERGRPLPLLQFEPVTPELPLLHPGELALAEPFEPVVFKSKTLMEIPLSAIYFRIGSSLDRSNLAGASRAVTILEAAHSLDPEAGTGELVDALRELSDGFASRARGNNLPESWRYLKRALELSEAESPDSETVDAIRKRSDRLSKQIERQFFHRIREHLLDGNGRAAEALVADLEDCGFEHAQMTGFRDQLRRFGEIRP